MHSDSDAKKRVGIRVSAWSVWLHPRRTARRLDEVEALAEQIREKDSLIDALHAEIQVGQDTIALLETEINALKSSAEDFRAKYNALNNQLHIAQEKAKELQADLDSHIDFDKAIANLESQLKQAEKMKKSFENQITILNLKYEQAQRLLRQNNISPSGPNTNPNPARNPNPAQNPNPNPARNPNPAQNPNPKSSLDCGPNAVRTKSPQKPKIDPTTWLRDLPESI